jgi:HK97 family phage major capsid protein
MSSGLSQKADIALSNLTSDGGLLNPEQNNTFIRRLIDTPTLLNRVRSVPMNAPTMKINKIQFGSRILQVAPQGTSPYMEDDGSNDRWLASARRSKPTTSQVSLSTQEIIAEVRIPYEVLEDNIEGAGMENTILALIAERAALDLEELLIQGDTTLSGSDPYLGLMDGVLKLAVSHVVDAAGATVNAGLFNSLKKALPTKYRRNLNQMAFFVSMDRETDYRLVVAGRGTPLGDAILTGTNPLPVLGIPMVGVALMPDAKGLLLNPQNVIFGIQRNVRIEQDRDIRSREVIIVLTARIAIQIEEEDALAKLTNLG